jgi:hypothetical protein
MCFVNFYTLLVTATKHLAFDDYAESKRLEWPATPASDIDYDEF